MKPWLNLNGRTYNIDDVSSVNPKSEFESQTLNFIKAWRSGQMLFKQQTSGSTGKPKTIEISRARMIASAMLTIKALKLEEGQNSLLCLSPEYIGGKMLIVRSLLNKMNIVAIEPSANPLNKLTHKIDFASFTPMQLFSVLEGDDAIGTANKISKIILGGGAVSSRLHEKIQHIESQCYSTYGMTETVSHIALKKLNGPDQSNYYKTFDEIDIDVDDRQCLTVSGSVTNFEKIYTNDRVRLIDKNQFEWLGRIDNIINSGGIKIQSEKIETTLEKLFLDTSFNHQFFIAGLKDDKLGERVTLFLEGQLDEKLKSTLNTLLPNVLDKYEIPKDILFVDHFKRTPNGKIDRNATIAQLSD
ncbi:hypothetical protein E1176_17285 [Fulvivirga sp. RKSG066]|uniref:AMP-binding protein n=1 Tax=Fulvivirga aurantia TaxID=2529383 RepID=UPI0012BCB8BE|nr:AMP-binding protein [Fulvivirga aurantia]MTI22789.1 hypothetical protein [Fulvivirga aurantia]